MLNYRYLSFIALTVATLTTVASVVAFGTATVTPASMLAIVTTEEALLALIPDEDPAGDNLANETATSWNTYLEIDLAKGYGGMPFGYQPGSSYSADKIFKVQNNSGAPKQLTVVVGGLDPGVTMKVTATDTATTGTSTQLFDTADNSAGAVTLAPNDWVHITLTVTVDITAGLNYLMMPTLTFQAA